MDQKQLAPVTSDDGAPIARTHWLESLRLAIRPLLDPTVGVSEADAGRLRAEMLASVVSITPNIMVSAIVGSILCAGIFWTSAAGLYVKVWAVCVILFSLRGLVHARRSAARKRHVEAPASLIRKLVLNVIIAGLVWSLLFVLAYPLADVHQKLLLSCIIVGVVTSGLFGMISVPPAAAAYAIAIFIPSTATLLMTDSSPQAANTIGMYAAFIMLSMASVLWYRRFFLERFITAQEVLRQNELIGILLHDFEENASDWLWETDAAGRLQLVAQGFAKKLGGGVQTLRGQEFMKLLGDLHADLPRTQIDHSPLALLKLAFSVRAPFNGLEIPVIVDGVRQWWSLTGKPVKDSAGNFTGYRGVGSDITLRRVSQDKITFMAHYDPLTELPNRALFQDLLSREIDRLNKKESAGFSVLFVDLDEFKAVNDGLGHGAGDRLLVTIGRRLRAALPDHAILARLGGDEFAVVIPGETDCTVINRIAEDMIRSASEPVLIDHHAAMVGASVGIAIAPVHGKAATDLLRRADLALYRAKELGRRKACFFEPSVEDIFQKRRKMEDALRVALDRNELDVYYQPIVDLQSGKIVSAEALLRWKNPEHGFVSPGEFIPVAEASGLIVPIGEWVLRRACQDAMAWPKDVCVSVNLSPVQFKSARLPAAIVSALAISHLPSARLELEITESVLMNEAEASSVIEHFRVLGTQLSLDDFGVGYSSLSYLRKFPFNKIKIDQSFVRDARTNPLNYGIIETIVALGKKLNMAITVEGIEDGSDIEKVQAAGCHYAQGYFFGRPMPKHEMLALFGKKTTEIDGGKRNSA